MAICIHCSQDMTTATSCTVDVLYLDGRPVDVPPHLDDDAGSGGACPDCGVELGGLHHLGCDRQDCPSCGRQLISCRCPWEELARATVVDVSARRFPSRGTVPFGAAVAPMR